MSQDVRDLTQYLPNEVPYTSFFLPTAVGKATCHGRRGRGKNCLIHFKSENHYSDYLATSDF